MPLSSNAEDYGLEIWHKDTGQLGDSDDGRRNALLLGAVLLSIGH
jgi:hypothetical protein